MTNTVTLVNEVESKSAFDLVSEPRFRTLRSVIVDNIDKATVKYPVGYCNCFMSLDSFQEEYENQTERKCTYVVRLPISKIVYMQGGLRLVRPEYCVENFVLFNHTVDFCESESPVVFYDESTGEFRIVKKQHTTAQVAAIAKEKNQDIEIMVRVIAFKNVSKKDRSIEASKLFYKEIKGINTTKDWEALPHQVACGDQSAIDTQDFYKSISGFTWQPMDFPFPLVENPQFCCTKVAQMKKLVQYATNDGELITLRSILQTICNSVDWEREKPMKEVSSYLVRAFYNFEKRLHPLLDDALSGNGFNFDIEDHIEKSFANKTLKTYLGSTSVDKKPWQHLIKVASKVNTQLIESGQTNDNFFGAKNRKFIQEIYALANPSTRTGVSMEEVINYIKAYC